MLIYAYIIRWWQTLDRSWGTECCWYGLSHHLPPHWRSLLKALALLLVTRVWCLWRTRRDYNFVSTKAYAFITLKSQSEFKNLRNHSPTQSVCFSFSRSFKLWLGSLRPADPQLTNPQFRNVGWDGQSNETWWQTCARRAGNRYLNQNGTVSV